MKILALETPSAAVDWTKENETLKAEALQVYQLYMGGFLREIYFNEQHNAVLILECETMEKADELLKSLPLVQKGLIGFTLMQLMPYTGYDRILNQK